jgi:hypothetical protein
MLMATANHKVGTAQIPRLASDMVECDDPGRGVAIGKRPQRAEGARFAFF